MSYLEELLPEFRKGAKIRRSGCKPKNGKGYIYYKDGKIYNEFVREVEPDLGIWLSKDDWEIVQDEPIDWDYIIKNKCLCWFWDDEKCQQSVYSTLIEVADVEEFRFKADIGTNSWWNFCRPVRRDEVTFYEDREEK